ncbi:MAG TPA: DUF1328 domain-containing protein [Candidatus Babeliales bacterium]|nr:DUF1328 domain-containing protein [Candidatus Babeliales bacterium]
MIRWIITFLILSIIAGVLGFAGIEGMSLDIAKILFFIFVISLIISCITYIFRGKPRPPVPPIDRP